MNWRILIFLLLCQWLEEVFCFDCREVLKDNEIKRLDWPNLEQCLQELAGQTLVRNTSENIWRLAKAFDGIENIPADAYKKLGSVLTIIPEDELRNISMEQVEVVEAFGATRKNTIGAQHSEAGVDEDNSTATTFGEQAMRIIAQKVRHEWLGKTPETYSEYDLMTMSEIICYFNDTDIAKIHADAFKLAAEWIGNLQNCPKQSLQAFAALAVREDAFGKPSRWSRLDLSIIGNIINGLSQWDIESIEESKLYLNRYYVRSKCTTVTGIPTPVPPSAR